ncbi:hypothetical protein BHM03_00037105 [Ensete ventricosum]|nr:hypothetical protein BHM03_00037105 [Ensete ventricosum]
MRVTGRPTTPMSKFSQDDYVDLGVLGYYYILRTPGESCSRSVHTRRKTQHKQTDVRCKTKKKSWGWLWMSTWGHGMASDEEVKAETR